MSRRRRESGAIGGRDDTLRRRAWISIGVVFAALVISVALLVVRDTAIQPTNYLSEVTSIRPTVTGVDFDIAGGDAYLTMTVEPGHSASVPGYFNEPYVAVDRDGRVNLNQGSPAFFINQDRWGEVQVPPGVDPQDEPSWVIVRRDGSYAWHDHRVHWMSYDLPPTVAGNVEQTVFPWEVPTMIDGQEVVIGGELTWVPSESALPSILAGAFILLPFAIWGFSTIRSRSSVLLGATSLALMVAIGHVAAEPPSARGFPVALLLPSVAAVATGLWLNLRHKISPEGGMAFLLADAALLTWVVFSIGALWKPVVPNGLPNWMVRAGVAATGLGSLALVGAWWLASVRGRFSGTKRD